ncbi:metallophosphoesterase [Desulfofarcimen acetoxidans DSM 771]|uniref:Metallophosphoesterase n=1 Tax=Desulfofarcimen acetoxidans (strain ATCC 49208 / DSM 771 / KCTC 5769 / VKM B-1644 / 5575) TaxID=485916 RepID=C8W6U0_DESAS|nr:metallophosphoesterase family protein [Desulfofarcimen acetoxidans]ACV64199.1 metallophosphoesterase [Desulfofarcimen acetoxidans DSM 771]
MKLIKRNGKSKHSKIFRYLVIWGIVSSLLMVVNQCMAADNSAGSGRPDEIILSWTGEPETTQTVCWRAYAVGSGKIQYMRESDKTDDFSGALEKAAACTELHGGFNHFEAELDNLQPGTDYVYRVGSDGCWSEPAAFTTAAPTDKFSFMFMGDVHAGHNDMSAGLWQQLLAQAIAGCPDVKFALQAGDLVDEADDPEQWSQLFSAAAGVFNYIPLMPAEGNHENTDASLYFKYFALPGNGPSGYEEKDYSFDYGNCHFVVLDSNYLGTPADSGYDKISTWLKNDLAGSLKQWKFVVLHYPPYPVVPDNHAENLQENWVPLFEQGGVDMVFVGHQHVYMRTKPLLGNQVQPDGQGIVYIMGLAGNKYYAAGPNYDYIAKEVSNASNYEVININGDTLSLTAKDAEGRVIDSYMYIKQPVNVDAAYTVTPLPDVNYQSDAAEDGISKMTVNSGVAGMKYFSVQVASITEHHGNESLVFTHERNGIQLNLNITKADFDVVDIAQSGFNVQPGDVIKVFMVDGLTNEVDSNPKVLQ